MSGSYWRAVFKNIVGFIPLGFFFYAYLVTLRSIRRPALVTVVLGAAVSFTIEALQAFLPTRESGTTDLITNSLGTWIGVLSYRLLTPAVTRIFPWLPFLPRSSEISAITNS
jgi:glycopeptide antibiotics resistance protein